MTPIPRVVARALVVAAAVIATAAPAGATPAGAATGTTLPPKGKGLVHITVRGSRDLVLDGTAVECAPGGGTTNVAIDSSDYPELGKGGYLVVIVPLAAQFTPSVRARIARTKYSTLGAQDQAKWKVAGRKVTFSKVDADGGREGIRVSGAVVCP
ncbi:MAG: hypothetical protein U0W40_14835 [Acidimicrobiia bacterium]